MTKIEILVANPTIPSHPATPTSNYPLLKTSLLELEIMRVRVGWWVGGVTLILKQVNSQLDWPTGSELGLIENQCVVHVKCPMNPKLYLECFNHSTHGWGGGSN